MQKGPGGIAAFAMLVALAALVSDQAAKMIIVVLGLSLTYFLWKTEDLARNMTDGGKAILTEHQLPSFMSVGETYFVLGTALVSKNEHHPYNDRLLVLTREEDHRRFFAYLPEGYELPAKFVVEKRTRTRTRTGIGKRFSSVETTYLFERVF